MLEQTTNAVSGWKDFPVSRQIKDAISGRDKVSSSSDDVPAAERWLASALASMGFRSQGAGVDVLYFPATKQSSATLRFHTEVAGPVQVTIDNVDLRRGKLSLNAYDTTTKLALAFVERVVERVMNDTNGAKQAFTISLRPMGHYPDMSVAFFAQSLNKQFDYVFDDRSSSGTANANWNGVLAVTRGGKLVDEASILKQVQGFVAEVLKKDAAITKRRTVNALWGYTMSDAVEPKK